MKAACKSLKTSILFSLVFLLLTIILAVLSIVNNNQIIDICLNVVIGLFGSSFVALLLAIPAYKVAKKQILEKYWEESRILIKNISSIEYLECDYDVKTIIYYIHELNNVEIFKDLKVDKSKEKYLKGLLIDEYISRNQKDLEKYDSKTIKKMISDSIDSYIVKFRNNAKLICEQYIFAADNYSTQTLSFLLGDIEFISGKKEYEKMHKNLYQTFFDIIDEIQSEAYHFRLFNNDEGNEAIVIEKIIELQKHLYRVEKKTNKEYDCVIVYKSFRDKMLINLEEFRANLYGIDSEKQKLYPVFTKTINKK